LRSERASFTVEFDLGIEAIHEDQATGVREHRYRIYSLVRPSKIDLFGVPRNPATDFVIECEKYGIPQARHRVILLGVRDDVSTEPSLLIPTGKSVKTGDVLEGLPRLRSGLSHGNDDRQSWQNAMKRIREMQWLEEVRVKAGDDVLNLMLSMTRQQLARGGLYAGLHGMLADS